MTENVEHPLLEHLKRFQATLERLERKVDDLTVRASSLGGAMASIMQHLADHSATYAQQQVAIDNVNRRLDRIERRLELTH